MPGIVHLLRRGLKFIFFGLVGILLVTLRYIIKTPQPLKSLLPGNDHIYKWTHGHVFYKVLGQADAPPLLLLHAPGIGASAYEMCPLMERLAQHYRVYAPDLLGFGLSDHPGMIYTADTYVKLGRDFLVEVIGQPATLLASGLSCNYSVAIALDAPDLCKGVVLLSPTLLFARSQLRPWLARIAKDPLVALVLYSVVTTPFVLRWIVARERAVGYQALSQTKLEHIVAAAHQLGGQHAALAYLAGSLDLDVTNQLESLTRPGLIVWGANALHQTHAIASRCAIAPLKEATPIQDAGVYVQEECPDEVVASILAWSVEDEHEKVSFSPAVQVQEPAVLLEEGTQQEQEVEKTVAVSAQSATQVEAYCVKCRQKRMMQNAARVVTKNGRAAMEGQCPVCGTKLFRFIAG